MKHIDTVLILRALHSLMPSNSPLKPVLLQRAEELTDEIAGEIRATEAIEKTVVKRRKTS